MHVFELCDCLLDILPWARKYFNSDMPKSRSAQANTMWSINLQKCFHVRQLLFLFIVSISLEI